MGENFIKRDICPCCTNKSYHIIYSLPFSDQKIWPFLNSYYEKRISKSIVGSYLFNIAQCDKCSLLFQEYILNDFNMYLLYEKWICAQKSLYKKKNSDINLYRNYAFEIEGICKFFNKNPYEINILEFGMGWGIWSNLAKAYNYNIIGAEISKTRINFAQQNGLKIIKNIFIQENDKFDYIYSNQVFEHIPHPLETLKQLARILKPNGIIHIIVPNGISVKKELKNRNWIAKKGAIQPLEHINCFTRKSLKALANQAELSLRPPLYRPRFDGMKKFFKSNLRYIFDLYWSTQIYLNKRLI